MKRKAEQLHTPELSQADTLSNNLKNGNSIKRTKCNKKVQTILNFPFSLPTFQSKTCTLCSMCYLEHIEKDRVMHEKYHSDFVNGIAWQLPKSQEVIHSFKVKELVEETRPSSSSKRSKNKCSAEVEASIIIVSKTSPREIRRTEQLLTMVNQELNALPAANWWLTHSNDSAIQGKAFIVIIGNKAVGVCIVDPIIDTSKQCRWMIYRTQKIVSNQVNKLIKIGISRIWIAPRWRRNGLASQLLNTTLENMVYGMHLGKEDIGFSQPSYGGGLLAKSFNGVTHKSGEILIPVYID